MAWARESSSARRRSSRAWRSLTSRSTSTAPAASPCSERTGARLASSTWAPRSKRRPCQAASATASIASSGSSSSMARPSRAGLAVPSRWPSTGLASTISPPRFNVATPSAMDASVTEACARSACSEAATWLMTSKVRWNSSGASSVRIGATAWPPWRRRAPRSRTRSSWPSQRRSGHQTRAPPASTPMTASSRPRRTTCQMSAATRSPQTVSRVMP